MTKTQKSALEIFQRYPNAKEVYVTADGQAFLHEDRAKMHNRDFETVKRSDVIANEEAPEQAGGTKPEKKKAEELIELIPTVATVAELDALAEGETRKTVLAAIEARRTELANDQKVE